MKKYTSKFGSHIYVKGSVEAVEFYKDAFLLEEEEPWLDDQGLIIHQTLVRNGELFLSVSEDIYLPEAFRKIFSADVCPPMLFCAYFHNKEDLEKTYEILVKGSKIHTEIQVEGEDYACDIVDRYGVFWHLRLPKDLNASYVQK